MNTGKRIAELRLLFNLTQDELAERMHVSRSLVEKWENGTRRPDAGSVEKMAELFRVTPESIVERDGRIERELSSCMPQGTLLDSHELAAALNDFLPTLRELDRQVFMRRYHFLDRLSDIAGRYGISEGHVGVILFRTRKKLKKYLEKG